MISYIKEVACSDKRAAKADGGNEQRMYESAVMIAMAQYLMRLQRDAGEVGEVAIHPDGQHDRQFGFEEHLGALGFQKTSALGKTSFGGVYQLGQERITVFPRSGLGDVVADVCGRRTIVECKGGTINSRHAGVLSRARTSLSELIGQLMVLPQDGARQIAARPWTRQSADLAERLAPRCRMVGIEIVLIHPDGQPQFFASPE